MPILAQWKSSRETEKGQGRVRVKKKGRQKGGVCYCVQGDAVPFPPVAVAVDGDASYIFVSVR